MMELVDVEALREYVASLPLHERWFLLLVGAIGTLLVLSVLFTGYTIFLRLRNLAKERLWGVREERWTQVVLEALTSEGPVEEVVSRIPKGDRLPFLDFLQRYARRVRGPERRRLDALARPFLSDLLPELANRNPYQRARAVQTLGMLGYQEHRSAVARMLDDPAPFVAMVASRAVLAQGDQELAPKVLARLERFGSWSVEYLTGLLSRAGVFMLPHLRAVMVDTSRPGWVRTVAVRTLEELHDAESADAAAAALAPDPEPDLAVALLRLLAEVGRGEHLPRVLALTSAEHEGVRGAAFRGVGALGGKDDLPLLLDGLHDPSPWVAIRAARALREVGGDGSLEAIFHSPHPRADLAGQVLKEKQ